MPSQKLKLLVKTNPRNTLIEVEWLAWAGMDFQIGYHPSWNFKKKIVRYEFSI